MNEEITTTATVETPSQSVNTQTDATTQSEGLDNSGSELTGEGDNSNAAEPQKPDKFSKFRNVETGEVDYDKVLASYEESEQAKSRAFNERDELRKQYEQNSLNQERGTLTAYGQQLNAQRAQLLQSVQANKDNQIAQAYQALQDQRITDLDYTQYVQRFEAEAFNSLNQINEAYRKDMTFAQQQEAQYKNKLYTQQEAEFIAKNQDFYNKPYIKPVMDEIIKEFLPENLPRVKEFTEKMISLYEQHKAGVLQNEADKAKLTSVTQQPSPAATGSKIFTRSEIDKMSVQQYEKNEKAIMEQLKKRLIK
jgi:hypothetical protein